MFGQGVHVTTNAFVSWNLGALAQGTVEFWAKVDTESPNGSGLVFASYQPNNWSTFFTGLVTNQIRSVYVDANDVWQGMTTPDIYTTSLVIKTNTWHHYATTWGSQGFHFYVDGSLIYSSSATLGQFYTTYWCISFNSALGNLGYGFNGVIDELRISNFQRVFAPTPSPQVSFVKAFTVDYSNLSIGSNYQAQASLDLINWTNWGAAFTATSSNYTNTNYQRISDWNQLFFRLVQQSQ
jgi:hypothetical protein